MVKYYKVARFLQNFLISLIISMEVIFFGSFFINIDKITVIDSTNIISLKNLWLLIFPIGIMCINGVLNKIHKNKIKNKIPGILLIFTMTFFLIRNLVISCIIANKEKINSYDHNFNRLMIWVTLAALVSCSIIIFFVKRKINNKDWLEIITSTMTFAFELNVMELVLLIVEIIVYSNLKSQIIFNTLGILGEIIILIIEIKRLSIFSSGKNNLFFRIEDFLKILQIFLVCFLIEVIILWSLKISLDTYSVTLLTLSFAGLVTVLLYKINFEEFFGDKYFFFTMVTIFTVPLIVYLMYYQSHIVDKASFSKIMFGVILALGAILLLIVGEDVQLLNGYGLTRKLTISEKRKIAAYKLRVSNGVIIATFMNLLFSKINKFIDWIHKVFKQIDRNWLLIILLILAILGIIIGSFILTWIEKNAFKHFQTRKSN